MLLFLLMLFDLLRETLIKINQKSFLKIKTHNMVV